MALINGRPDSLSAQYIYPSGQGGVIDDRLPASDMSSPEEAAKVDAKVKNGTYRGVEKLAFTYFSGTAFSVEGEMSAALYLGAEYPVSADDPYRPRVGDVIQCRNSNSLIWGERTIVSVSYQTENEGRWLVVLDAPVSRGSNFKALLTIETNITVEGNATQGFSCQTVYGPPEKILTSSLSQGWLGTWGGLSETSPLTLTRKALSTQSAQVSADGSSWTSSTPSLNSTLNEATVSFNADDIVIINYTAGVYPTEQDVNRPVLNGEQGLGSVSARNYYLPALGSIFSESLIHKVITNTTSYNAYGDGLRLSKANLHSNGSMNLGGTERYPTHTPLSLATPNNNSPAVKALMYQTSENQLLHLNYAYNEIAYDSVDSTWNDDSTISVLTGQGTYTNQGAVTLLAGTNRTSKPYGYSKNKARAGAQVEGVDL